MKVDLNRSPALCGDRMSENCALCPTHGGAHPVGRDRAGADTDASTCSKILSLLNREGCPYELIRHQPAGETAFASRVRGHELSEAAKSLVLEAIGRENSDRRYYLAVVPGDRKVDLKFLRGVFDVKRVQFASESKAQELTGCVMGAVPPFTFHASLQVVLDMAITERERVVFNAGKLDLSIAMRTDDFLKLVGSKEGYYARNNIAMERE